MSQVRRHRPSRGSAACGQRCRARGRRWRRMRRLPPAVRASATRSCNQFEFADEGESSAPFLIAERALRTCIRLTHSGERAEHTRALVQLEEGSALVSGLRYSKRVDRFSDANRLIEDDERSTAPFRMRQFSDSTSEWTPVEGLPEFPGVAERYLNSVVHGRVSTDGFRGYEQERPQWRFVPCRLQAS